MPLPNADRAVVDMRKLEDYCLDPTHPRGKHKARVFSSVLDLTQENAEQLRAALLDAAQTEEAERLYTDEYGTRYELTFQMTRASNTATICSAWIVRSDETFPRLVTCYVC
jgi:hypothetical protein